MAYNNIEKLGIDKSDLDRWSRSPESQAFLIEIKVLKDKALSHLLKNGSAEHDTNSATFKAFESVEKLFIEAQEK